MIQNPFLCSCLTYLSSSHYRRKLPLSLGSSITAHIGAGIPIHHRPYRIQYYPRSLP